MSYILPGELVTVAGIGPPLTADETAVEQTAEEPSLEETSWGVLTRCAWDVICATADDRRDCDVSCATADDRWDCDVNCATAEDSWDCDVSCATADDSWLTGIVAACQG